MASPFAKYQSEQVQQLAPGFVEAYGNAGRSIGQGIAGAASAIAQGMEKADQVKREEAKQQAIIGSYLKRDPRVQGVNAFLANGDLKKDDQGNVYLPEENKDRFDPVKTADAIALFNKTGGDGSRLTGDALTRFAVEFEADKKYEADQAAKEGAALERRKLLADISKTEAEAAEKYARAGISGVLGAFGSGQDMSTYQPPATGMPSPIGISAIPAAPAVSSFLAPAVPQFGGTTLGVSNAPSGFTPERYQAGVPLATTLKTASTAPAVATTPNPVSPAPAPDAVKAPMRVVTDSAGASKAYITEIPKLQSARTQLDNEWQKEAAMFSANYQITMSRLTAMGATSEDIKAAEATAKTQYQMKVDRYNANVASIESRLSAFQKTADETRAAEKAAQSKAGEKREDVKFETEYGAAGQPVTPGKFKTFNEKVEAKINNAGIIPGRTGGTKAVEMQAAAQDRHTQIMEKFPTWYDVGLTTEGGNQYQWKMLDYPTAAGISPTVRGNVQTVVEGYAEGRVFLTKLLEVVQSTDENAIKNYLDRFLVTTSKDDTFAEGEALGQFGVAAFRRAIVSGGNFSDADREYVQKLITQINSPNVFRDKDKMMAQTKKLAEFIDSKFRSTLAANGVRVDMKTSEAFLKREDIDGSNAAGLDNLKKAKAYYKAYNIDDTKAKKPSRGSETLDAAYIDKEIEAARAGKNLRYVKILEDMKKQHIESKEKAVKKAKEEAARARGA
jgi:hypothetical protein